MRLGFVFVVAACGASEPVEVVEPSQTAALASYRAPVPAPALVVEDDVPAELDEHDAIDDPIVDGEDDDPTDAVDDPEDVESDDEADGEPMVIDLADDVVLVYDDPRDADDDEIADRWDDCPTTPEDIDGFEDDDGCPDADQGGELVLDEMLDEE